MEIWKDIIGYEGLYEVSNFGNIKSLGNNKKRKEKIRKPTLDSRGYLHIGLNKNGKCKSRTIHQLVAESFLNHKPCGLKLVVNHIDVNKQNNKSDNLEIVTNRENSNRKHLKSSSKYVGVSWYKERNKWLSFIRINGKQKYLGSFSKELDAGNAYQNALKEIKERAENIKFEIANVGF